MDFLIKVTVVFCFIGLLVTPFLKGVLTCYCLAASALALSVLEALKIVRSEGDWKMFITEIAGCVFLVILSSKIRKHKKTQEVEDGRQ